MQADTRPLILVNGELGAGETPTLTLAIRYARAIEAAGGVPVAVVPLDGRASEPYLDAVLARADGLLLGGGDDFDTGPLGLGPTHPAAKPVPGAKQRFDLALARAALGRDLPLLGVCYGMQLLALAEQGRLLQHLPEDRPGCQEHRGGVVHDVRPVAGSKLAEIVGILPFPVVSRHHQALAEAGPRWTVSAHDGEGLIEAIERPGQVFRHAVQWHPELAPEEPAQARLFAAFVDAARAYACGSARPAEAAGSSIR